MESSSTTSPEQQLADGLHTVWEAREHPVEASCGRLVAARVRGWG
jgi:hypothetical protein